MSQPGNNSPQPVSIKRRFFSIPTLLSFGVAAVLMFLLATRFNLDWSATWDNVRKMNPGLYLLAILMYYLSFAFRGLRWQILARNAGISSSPEAKIPSALHCSRLILAGWFVNSITWLRLGDAYRAYAFAEDSRSGFSWSLGTVLAERVIDMSIVLGLIILSVLLLTTTRGSAASDYVLFAATAMAFAMLMLLFLMRKYGVRLAQVLPDRLEAAYYHFQRGTLGGFKQLHILGALGVIAWFLEMTRLFLVIQALDLSVELPLVALAALGHAILSTVPTPGGVGAVEPGVTGLLLLSLDRHDAVSVTVVDRSITYVSVIVLGGIIFLARQLSQARRGKHQVPATHHTA